MRAGAAHAARVPRVEELGLRAPASGDSALRACRPCCRTSPFSMISACAAIHDACRQPVLKGWSARDAIAARHHDRLRARPRRVRHHAARRVDPDRARDVLAPCGLRKCRRSRPGSRAQPVLASAFPSSSITCTKVRIIDLAAADVARHGEMEQAGVGDRFEDRARQLAIFRRSRRRSRESTARARARLRAGIGVRWTWQGWGVETRAECPESSARSQSGRCV